MFTLAFYITSAIVFLLLGVLWRRSDWFNAVLKVLLIIMAAWAALNTAMHIGLVIKG